MRDYEEAFGKDEDREAEVTALDSARDFYEYVVELLYMKGPLDRCQLVSALEELGYSLGSKMALKVDIQVQRKGSVAYLDEWVEDNVKYLEGLKLPKGERK